ncbi:MAG: PilN domain-containing protein [Thermaerobacter sp.]|nr:PilN domain-containing protein [Thermaerobacter sp.]
MKVNLLPLEMRRRSDLSPYQRYLGGFVAALVLLPMLYTLMVYLDTNRLSREEAALEARLEVLRPLEGLLAERNTLAQEVQVLRQAMAAREKFAPSIYLEEMLKLLPPQTILADLALDRETLRFSGTLGSYTEAAYLLVLFESSPLFTNPVLSHLTADEAGFAYDFTVELAGGEE